MLVTSSVMLRDGDGLARSFASVAAINGAFRCVELETSLTSVGKTAAMLYRATNDISTTVDTDATDDFRNRTMLKVVGREARPY